MTKYILLIIEGRVYEVSGFENKHPGEGIRDTYLRNYSRRDVTGIFEKYHDEGYEILDQARKNGECRGVKFISMNFFGKKIPKSFIPVDSMSDLPINLDKNEYLLTNNPENPNNSLYIIHRKGDVVQKNKIEIINKKFIIRGSDSSIIGINTGSQITMTFNSMIDLLGFIEKNGLYEHNPKNDNLSRFVLIIN